MKLWHLTPVDDLPEGDDPWETWFDKVFGFVIRAETEGRARQIAHENAGHENKGTELGRPISETKSPWLDPAYSCCVELTADGPEDVVISDLRQS